MTEDFLLGEFVSTPSLSGAKYKKKNAFHIYCISCDLV